MGKIIALHGYFEGEPDVDSMDREELLSYLSALRKEIGELDVREPEDMDSEAYEAWGDRHEELEDLVDEVLDRLDELT